MGNLLWLGFAAVAEDAVTGQFQLSPLAALLGSYLHQTATRVHVYTVLLRFAILPHTSVGGVCFGQDSPVGIEQFFSFLHR